MCILHAWLVTDRVYLCVYLVRAVAYLSTLERAGRAHPLTHEGRNTMTTQYTGGGRGRWEEPPFWVFRGHGGKNPSWPPNVHMAQNHK